MGQVKIHKINLNKTKINKINLKKGYLCNISFGL